MDLYLYQVSLTWEMKISWKLVRNSLYTEYLSEMHCNDVWQFQKWITVSGAVSTPSCVQPSQAHLHVCMDMPSKAKHRGNPTGWLQFSGSVRCRIRAAQTFALFRADSQEPVMTWPHTGQFSHLLNSSLKIQWTVCGTDGTMNATEGLESCRCIVVQLVCTSGSLPHCQVHIS